MRTIGLIGGLSWLSTVDYYRMINQMVNKELGGVSSAKLLMYSVDFAEIKTLTEAGDWQGLTKIMCDAAGKLQAAGAECILIGANTMHQIADQVQDSLHIPLINIAEVVADAICEKQLKKVALLGTKYTMQFEFYHQKLAAKGISTVIPNEAEIEMINTAIYTEMGKGILLPATKEKFLEVMSRLQAEGAEGVILGCTEIPILIKQEDCSIPVFDTAYIHSAAAVAFALS